MDRESILKSLEIVPMVEQMFLFGTGEETSSLHTKQSRSFLPTQRFAVIGQLFCDPIDGFKQSNCTA